jgi:hypothetical protein
MNSTAAQAATCNACGKPSAEEFCTRVECLTYGGGAVVAGPSILNPRFFPVKAAK